ncbi:MAG: glycosyltransferase [Lachnospiraceae bacterium]|nr:glycosyltransferase [Lachnospiraceae bacterium]
MGWTNIFLTLTQILITIFGLHFVIVAAFLLKKKRDYPEKNPATRFAVLIAARNEADVIEGLLTSLKEQDYPDDLYDVFVIPNNCTDRTEEVAQEAGVRIYHCPYPVRTKGEVLHQTIPHILSDSARYDAICVFDADNIVDPAYLSRMNDAFCAGVRAAQGYRDSKNPYDSWVSASYSIYFKMNNLFYNKPRSLAGMSALISGTGFCACREVFEKLNGWNTRSMTEDSEFTSQCVLAGEQIAYIENARFFDEQPIRFRDSLKQRKRWSNGLLEVSNLYRGRFLKAYSQEKKFVFWDYFMFTMTPFAQILSVLPFVLPVLTMILTQPSRLVSLLFWAKLLLPVLTAYLGTILMASVTVLYRCSWDRRIMKGVLGYGPFLLSWIPLQFYCLFHKKAAWEEIRHTRNIRKEKLLKNEF